VWPRRKVRLITTASSSGLKGVQTLLEALTIEYDLYSWTEELVKEDNSNFQDPWFIKGVYWSEVMTTELMSGDTILGCHEQQTIQDYLHNVWEGEILIPVSESCVLWNDRPLIWTLLQEAGFEPSLLWQNGEQWYGVRGRGTIWIVPSNWLSSVVGKTFMGRPKVLIKQQTSWRIREQYVDFYAGSDCHKFIGVLPRWPELAIEQAVYETISLTLNLGVSWFDIKQVLAKGWKDGFWESPRCEDDDTGQLNGPQREEFPFAGFDDLENRWTG